MSHLAVFVKPSYLVFLLSPCHASFRFFFFFLSCYLPDLITSTAWKADIEQHVNEFLGTMAHTLLYGPTTYREFEMPFLRDNVASITIDDILASPEQEVRITGMNKSFIHQLITVIQKKRNL